MAWNEPGNNNGNGRKDPWSDQRNDQGPPDLDEAFRRFKDRLGGLFGGGSGGPSEGGDSGSGGLGGGLFVVLLVVGLALFAYNALYTVNQQERAVVLRFGRYIDTEQPGLHWKIPLIDQVYKVNVTRVRDTSHRELMLTEDENIVDVAITVQYLIRDPKAYVIQVRDSDLVLKNATESALRHVVGTSQMDLVISEGRQQIAAEVSERLQEYLNDYRSGLTVVKVNIEEAKPPQEVQAAFDDVIKAREDETRFRNQAEAYANGIIPEARGYAQRQLQEARAYEEQVVARAEGETARFGALLDEYELAPEVTRERLYIDAMQEVLTNSSAVMIDAEGNNMVYLPLDRLLSEQGALRTPEGLRLERSQVRELADQVLEDLRSRQSNGIRREGR
ncbi:MAG: FtsH protease activity modulator HflK [Pseudomonadota bacterium]|nr:FtsH protease activity modulator HflK [Pseudomonadota bacterium]